MNAIHPQPAQSKPDAAHVLSVGFILADNFTLSAFSLFVDHLRLAADDGDFSRPIMCRWSIMASQDAPVRASCGVTVGICTGSFILCRAGLMTGRRCCVSWYHCQDFLDEFPHHHPVADRMFVIDGDRITCSGGAGAADLATFLIDRHLGRAVAQKARHVLLLDRARDANDAQPHPPVSDSLTEEVNDHRVRRALLLMEQNLADPLPIADIADRLKLSTRQLERLFQSVIGVRPVIFYRMLRLRYARWLLDHTDRSVTDIALESGFSDCAHFSRQFKTMVGQSPSDVRAVARKAALVAPFVPGQPEHMAGMRLFK
jgi:transcriptional regulator GlxA family with amidase domain